MAKSQTFDSLGCGKNIPADLYQAGEFEAFYFMDVDYIEGNFPHFHNYYELLLVMQGNINIAAEGKLHHIPVGSIIIVPPHTEHYTIVLKDTKIYERISLHWMPSFLERLTETGQMPEGDFFQEVSIINCSSSGTAVYRILLERFMAELHTLPRQARLTANSPCAAELHSEYTFSSTDNLPSDMKLRSPCGKQNFSYDKFSLKIQEATLTELLLRCARDIYSMKAAPCMESSLTVSRVIEYINCHYQDSDLSLNCLSKLFFISSGNLSKLFRTYTGTTVYQYIIQKRLFCAQNLLAKDSSVLEACLSCGFQDYSSFLKAFRRTFHCTPKEFQKAVKV